MRLVLKIILFLASLSSTAAFAYVRPGPGEFAIDAEYLLWRPVHDFGYFVEESNLIGLSDVDFVTEGSRHKNNFRWGSGFRLEGFYGFCNRCNDVRLKWTWFEDTHSRTIDGPFLAATQGFPQEGFFGAGDTFPGSADSRLRVKYHAVDLLFGQTLYSYCDCCPFDLYLQAGFQYAHFHFDERILYNIVSLASFIRNDFKDRGHGIGPEVGLDFRYYLGCYCSWLPLTLTGNFRTALLVQCSEFRFDYLNTDSGVHHLFRSTSNFRIVPFWDLRFGLNYVWCCSCFKAAFEIGYEVLSYHKAVHKTEYLNAQAGFSEEFYSNLGFHGPYFLVGVSF